MTDSTTVSSLLAEYDDNQACLTAMAESSLANSHIPLLGHLCGDLPEKVVWKMMYMSYHQLRAQDRCTMLSVVTDYIVHSPVFLETAVNVKSGTSSSDIIRVLAQCWLKTLLSAKRGLDVQSFNNLTMTLTRCVSQLRVYHLHRPFKVVLKQAIRLKELACADLASTYFPPTVDVNFPRIAEISYNKMRRFRSCANLATMTLASTVPTSAFPSTPTHQKMSTQTEQKAHPSSTNRQTLSTPVRLLHSVPDQSRSTTARKEPSTLAGMPPSLPARQNTFTPAHIFHPTITQNPSTSNRMNSSTLALQNSPTSVQKRLSPQARQIPITSSRTFTSTLARHNSSVMSASVPARQIPSTPPRTNISTLARQTPSAPVHMSPSVRAPQNLSTLARQIPSTPPRMYASTLARQNLSAQAYTPPSTPLRQNPSTPGRQSPSLLHATSGLTLYGRHTPTHDHHTPSTKTPLAPYTPSQPNWSRNIGTSPRATNRLTDSQRLLIHAELKRLHLVTSSPSMPLHTSREAMGSSKRSNSSVAASDSSALRPTGKQLVEARQLVHRRTAASSLHPTDRTVTKELFFN
ncbi:mucin-2-like [Haliotis cracherodii]|uniref:mucin-2-like n=1 Tax=Haliotis cracherodii TaxID=6455 RepID=UPI0039ECF246